MPVRTTRVATGLATATVQGTYVVPAGRTLLVREIALHNRLFGSAEVILEVQGETSSVPSLLHKGTVPGASVVPIRGCYTVLRGGDTVRVIVTGADASVRATLHGSLLAGLAS